MERRVARLAGERIPSVTPTSSTPQIVLPVGLPVFCAGVTPNSCSRSGPGTAGLPVVMGGASVDAGDIAVADRDGVVVVPRERVDEVCRQLPDVRRAEEDLTRRVRLGLDNIDAVRELMASSRVRYVD